MKLYLDGILTPWPKSIVVDVEPAGEETSPLGIELRGGQLQIPFIDVTVFGGLFIIGPRDPLQIPYPPFADLPKPDCTVQS